MHPAHAADTATRKNVRQLAERLIQCKGSKEDLAVFNRWVDQKQLGLTPDEGHEPWGGRAWTLDEPLSVETLSSDVLVMNTRKSFFLQISSRSPRKDLLAAAKSLVFKEKINEGNHFLFERSGTSGTLQLMSVGDVEQTPDYLIGCAY